MGSGGSGGATRDPHAYIVTARRVRTGMAPANDNRPPLRRRLIRAAILTVLASVVAGGIALLF